jgi:5-(carboxyamino)imidazole ribonucleotide synthase
MGQVTCLLEKMLPLAYEVSVLTARGADGESVVYPIAENVHRDGILFTTTVPGPNVSEACATLAQEAARAIVAELGYVGVLCIEFFVLADGSLVVNEMAPRPHNSGHYTMDACVTSQFAQQVRAMARLPLGDVRQHSPAVMLNILGDVWFDRRQRRHARTGMGPDAGPAWRQPAPVRQGRPAPRRKMGHLTLVAPTLEQAQRQLQAACAILGSTGPRRENRCRRPGRHRHGGARLEAGGLVAFPTETVYGLGADAENPAAVARIYPPRAVRTTIR